METKEKTTILDELGISQDRGIEIHQYVFEQVMENKSVSDTIITCVTNLDFNTKELVIASFYIGQIHQMSQKEFDKLAEMYQFKKTMESVLNRIKGEE